jgi:hypothetical protein
MNKSQKMTKGTKIYCSIATAIIMGLIAYIEHIEIYGGVGVE